MGINKATENILNNVNVDEFTDKLNTTFNGDTFSNDIDVNPLIDDDEFDDWEDDDDDGTMSISEAVELDGAFDLHAMGIPTKYDALIDEILDYEEEDE